MGLYTDLNTTELCANGAEFIHLPPVQGGLLDQPLLILNDMFNFYAVKARLLYEQRQENDLSPDATPRKRTKPSEYVNMPDMVTESLFD